LQKRNQLSARAFLGFQLCQHLFSEPTSACDQDGMLRCQLIEYIRR
jgi:hypothetical protein